MLKLKKKIAHRAMRILIFFLNELNDKQVNGRTDGFFELNDKPINGRTEGFFYKSVTENRLVVS